MYKKYHLLQKPESIFVVTELKIAAYPRASAYIACNAHGMPLAPFVVFHHDPVDASRLSAYSLPEFKDALFFNARGAHDGDALFVWFRDHFRPSCCGHSVVLFTSCPVSEISLRLVQLAEEEHVALVSMPDTVAHLVQPLSSGILHSLNAAISAGIEQLLTDGKLAQSGSTLSHSLLAVLLAEVWADQWPCNNIREAFASCGIFPLNVRAISAERIAAASTSDNASDSYTTNESDDIDDDVTHGLNLLSELSTLEQKKESCTERLAAEDPQQQQPRRHCKNVGLNVNVSEMVDDAGLYRGDNAGSTHHCLQSPKSEVSEKVLKCFIAGDKVNELPAQASPSTSRSVVCRSYVFTSGNDSAQIDHTQRNVNSKEHKHSVDDTRHLVHATGTVELSNCTSARTCRNNSHKIRDHRERSSVLRNHCERNEATGVGRNVAASELTDRCVRQKPALTNELCEYNVPVCCGPLINVYSSNVGAPLQVMYCPSVGSSMPLNAEQADSGRTETALTEIEMPAQSDIDDSCHQVCCEVVIY